MSGLIILTLVLLPVLQTLPSNLLQPQTASATSNIVVNNVASTMTSLKTPPYATTLSSFNAGTGSNRLLIVGVESNNNNVASVTYGGMSLTKKVTSFFNNDAEFWYLVNPTGTGNIVVTMTATGLPTSVVVGAYALSGVDQNNPVPTSSSAHNTVGSSPSISITAQFANSWVSDSASIFGGATLTSPTCTLGWNLNEQDLVTGSITGASSYTTVATPGSVTCSWTASSSDLWDDVAIEVKAFTPTAPQSPTGLTSTQVSSQINLSWSAPSNDGGSTITGYKIERSTDPTGLTWSTIVANTGSTSTRYSDCQVQNNCTDLAAGASYTYRVSAINLVGPSSPSNTASATMLPSSYWTAKTGILIPLYTDPGGIPYVSGGWDVVRTVKGNHPNLPMYQIANFAGSNGKGGPDYPCDSTGNHAAAIISQQSSGVIVLGYVATGYGTTSEDTVETDIAQWKSCVPTINGIFFDEMNYPTCGAACGTTGATYYQDLTRYAKSLGMTYTIGNPGTTTDSSYLGSVDILNTWEHPDEPDPPIVGCTSGAPPTASDLQAATSTGVSGVDKHNFSFVSLAQPSLPGTPDDPSSDSSYVGWMYFTQDGGTSDYNPPGDACDPWNEIATYLDTLATDLDQ